MATELSQDAVLFFLQRQGGTVKNSDLILHFSNFIRDHPDRDRNRQFFKKFVNSVATVKQVDGVAHVTLRRQFRGYVPGRGAEVGPSDPPWVPVGKKTENAALNEPRQKPEQKEATTPAPPGETGMKTILPAAGILLNNNNNVEENFNRKQQQVNSTPGPVTAQVVSHIPQKPELKTPSLPTPPASDQASKGGQQRVGYGPLPGVTPAPPPRETSPGPEALRGRAQPERGLHQEASAHPQLALRRVKHRQSYKTAVSFDEDEEEEEVIVMQGSAGGVQPPNAPLSDPVKVTPAPSSVQRSYIQGTEGDMPTPRGPAGISLNNNSNMAANFSRKQQQVNSTPGQVIRPVTAQVVSHIPQKPELKTPSLPTPPASDQASKGGQQRVGYGPLPGVTPAPLHRETSPGSEALRRRSQPEEGLHQEAPAHPQLALRRVKHRQSYKTAVSFDEDEEEEEVIVMQGSAGGVQPPNAPLSDPVRVTPAPSSVQRSYIQGNEGDMPTPRGPAGISLNNNSNMAANFSLKQQQVNSTPGQVIRPVTAQVVSHIPQKPELKTPSLPTPPASDQASKGGQQRVGYGPLPGVTPAPLHRETSPGSEALRGRSQPEEGLHQEAPAHHQLIQRRAKHRQSYKTAVSFDEDEDEEEEFPMRRSSAGGVWPLNAPLGDTASAMSSSTPCIIDVPALPAVPQIYIQDAEDETLTLRHAGLAGLRLGPGKATKRSLPSETALHHNIRQDLQYSPPTREPRQGSNQSHSSIYSPSSDGGFSTRASGWTSSSGDLQTRAGEPVGVPRIQETVQRTRETAPESATSRADRKSTLPWHRSTGQLYDEQEASARLSPLHRSTDQLHEDQGSAARVMPWHLSTGDLCDRDEVETSNSPVSSLYMRHRVGVADQFSTKQMNRMCRSLGDDLDQIVQEEERGERGGRTEMARRSRLHRISSSLSLHNNLSCSSLSSCSTPPRCPSLTSLDEAVVQKGDKMNVSTEASPSSTQRDGRSRHALLPLESREHAWMIKGAAGNWTEIYSLFREDPSLLNKKDFISGFTVLHWIAKHGDHRVLNTLGYGAEKLSLTLDINARANSGHTPLHLAVMHGHKNIIRLLVKKFQADVKQRDVAGKRPWQYLNGDAPLEMFHVLGAPLQDVVGKKSVGKANSSWEQQQKQQRESRRLRHHASSASGERPLTVLGMVKVKRSTSLAALLKHKSLQKFHAQPVDTSV